MTGPSGNTDASTPSQASTGAKELAALRQDFPAFRIWQEIMLERVRYVARSQHPDARPHTVVTADPDELRAVLLRGEKRAVQ